ncbi:MAG: hypothetical protein OEY50_06470 [Nitrospinota bacterium]|nr:hypothetical protein [Nitrospinota bacterium]
MQHKRVTKSTIAALLAAVLVMPWNTAHAAAGNINVNVNVGNHIILNTIQTVNLTVTGVDAAVTEAVTDTGTVSFAGNPNTVAANLPGVLGDPAAFGTSITVTVTDAWAVRGVVAAGQSIQVATTIATGSATLGTSTVTAGTPLTSCGACGVAGAAIAAGASISFPAPGMGQANAVTGNVGFTLDISGATTSGNHTGIVLTVTASAV